VDRVLWDRSSFKVDILKAPSPLRILRRASELNSTTGRAFLEERSDCALRLRCLRREDPPDDLLRPLLADFGVLSSTGGGGGTSARMDLFFLGLLRGVFLPRSAGGSDLLFFRRCLFLLPISSSVYSEPAMEESPSLELKDSRLACLLPPHSSS